MFYVFFFLSIHLILHNQRCQQSVKRHDHPFCFFFVTLIFSSIKTQVFECNSYCVVTSFKICVFCRWTSCVLWSPCCCASVPFRLELGQRLKRTKFRPLAVAFSTWLLVQLLEEEYPLPLRFAVHYVKWQKVTKVDVWSFERLYGHFYGFGLGSHIRFVGFTLLWNT